MVFRFFLRFTPMCDEEINLICRARAYNSGHSESCFSAVFLALKMTIWPTIDWANSGKCCALSSPEPNPAGIISSTSMTRGRNRNRAAILMGQIDQIHVLTAAILLSQRISRPDGIGHHIGGDFERLVVGGFAGGNTAGGDLLAGGVVQVMNADVAEAGRQAD